MARPHRFPRLPWDRESPLWKTPAGEPQGGGAGGSTHETDSFPSHDREGRVFTADAGEGPGCVRLGLRAAEEETWPSKLDPVNWEVPGNQTQTRL